LELAEKRLPVAWQTAHCLGVPRRTPLMWQESQRARMCAPDSAKPVLMWSKRICFAPLSAAIAPDTVIITIAAAQISARTTDCIPPRCRPIAEGAACAERVAS
jgi:hypothetical protein